MCLAACGSGGLIHSRPCAGSAIFRDDVVVARLRGSSLFDPAIHCHYRRVGSTEESTTLVPQVSGVWDDELAVFAITIPGTTSGMVEYYFTYVKSNGDRSRVPNDGWFSCSAQ